MFAIVRNGVVVTLITPNTPFVFEEIQYPANWIALATTAEKDALGLKDVLRQPRPDPEYFDSATDAPVYDPAGDIVRIDQVASARPMTDLRAELKAKVDRQAYELIAPSDWMVARSVEDNTRPVPPQWVDYRETVRGEARRVKDLITTAKSVNDLMSVMRSIAWPHSP